MEFENFIYEKKDALSGDICDYVIKIYDNKQNIINNEFGFNLNKDKNEEHNILKNVLLKNIFENIKLYFFGIDCVDINNYFDCIQNKISIKSAIIHKYLKDDKTEKYCNVVRTDYKNMKYSIIRFIYYLNDCGCGGGDGDGGDGDGSGETIFANKYRIIPEKGKLVLFPSDCFFPYKETLCKTADKYVITGFIFLDV